MGLSAWEAVAVAAGTFVLTAALTLLIQLYIVPRVETRKRREDRWEQNLLELGELLSTQVRQSAQEAYHAQSTWRVFRPGGAIESQPNVNQAQLEEVQREWRPKTQQADDDLWNLVDIRVQWLVDRIVSVARGSDVIREFDSAARNYWVSVLFNHFSSPNEDDRTDFVFQDAWNRERVACRDLLKQVAWLADLRHPPRPPWRRRNQVRWNDIGHVQGDADDSRDLLGGPDPV